MTDLPRSGAARAHTLTDFDFTLPPELISHQPPAPERSAPRLLDGRTAPPVDRIFRELPGLLRAGDLLVSNDTRVLNARLFGAKASGGKLELLIERVLPPAAGSAGNEVAAHMKGGKTPQPASTVQIAGGRQAGGFDAPLLGRWPTADGPLYRFALHGPANESPWELMQRHGHLPLPPYIVRRQNTGYDTHGGEDRQGYQTLVGRHHGAV